MAREPSVEQIVDQILALNCGEQCSIMLDPRITQIDNLEWLLPICVEQFGTRIAIDQQAQGRNVVLYITAIQSRKHAPRERAAGQGIPRERAVGEPSASIYDDELSAVTEEEALSVA